jgi:ATP-dependent exoDNAse (exonuclease V) beta subunit
MVDPKTIDHQLHPLLPNEIIRASAGTGKTFALSNRYLVLLASGVDCQSILATTFTKKGAGEILDRIVQRLSAAALSDDAANELTIQLDFQITREHAANVLHELLKNLHRLEISTLDSFFNRVAKVFSLELGLPPIWDLVDEQQIQILREESVQAVLRSEELETIRHLMDKGESNRRIQTLLMDTVIDLYEDYRGSQFNAWDQLPEPNGWLTSTELETLILEAGQREYRTRKKNWDALHKLIEEENWAVISEHTAIQNVLDGGDRYFNSVIPEDAMVMIRQLIGHVRCWIVQRLRLRNLATRQLLHSFGNEFESAKDRLGQLFFDDIADRLKNFVQGSPTEQLAFRLDHQIQHLMLDEFQDTSPTQWSILNPFAHQVTRDGEMGRSFFCVGDMKQAIFGWRGGVAEIFDVVENQLPNLTSAKQMVKSYRSSPVVIEFVNELFGNLNRVVTNDDEVNAAVHSWGQRFVDHQTDRSHYPGHVTLEYAEDCDEQLAKSYSTTKDTVRNQNVVEAVVERVATLVQELPEHATIGVLARTNRDVGKIIFALQSQGIAASEEGGNPLTDSAAVELVLSAFHLADHPGDDVTRYHVSHSDLRSMFDLLPESDSNRAENRKAVAAGSASVRRMILEQGFGPTVETMANRLSAKCTHRERLRLQGLVEMAYADPQDTQRWSLRPHRFVQFVREKKVSDATSAQVRVMTIHRSKGLEFDAVVLPLFKVGSVGLAGMPSSLILDREQPADPAKMVTRYVSKKQQKFLPPNFQAAFQEDDRRKIREAMCLLYVAVTRAAHGLHIIVSCGEKPDSKTMGGVVLATMTEDPAREKGILYQSGDPRWFENLESSQPAPDQQTPSLNRYYQSGRKTLTRRNVQIGIQSRRGVNNVTPSALEGGDSVTLRQLMDISDRDTTAMERGTLLHACFDQVTWLDRSIPTADQLDRHLESVIPGSVLKRKVITEFFTAIKQGTFANLLNFETYREQHLLSFSDPRNRMEVHNERRFAATIARSDGTELIEGVVDRLVLVYQDDKLVAADVIDFKSDAIGPSELNDKVAQYGPQLAAYRDAISVSLGLPAAAISTRLAFISTGDVINLNVIEATVDASTQLKPSPPQRSTASPKATDETKQPRPKRVVDAIGPDGNRGDQTSPSTRRVVDQRTDNAGDALDPAPPSLPKQTVLSDPAPEPGSNKTTPEKSSPGKAPSKRTAKRKKMPKSPNQKTLWDE